MKEIVLVGGLSRGDNVLFELLKILFPECKIRILPSDAEDDGDIPVAQEEVKRERERSVCRSS